MSAHAAKMKREATVGCRVAAAAMVLVCVSSMALTMAADQAKANQAPKHSSVTVHCYIFMSNYARDETARESNPHASPDSSRHLSGSF